MNKRSFLFPLSSILLISNIIHPMERVTSRQTYREEDFSFPEDRGRNDHLLHSLVRSTIRLNESISQQEATLERLTRAESPYQQIPKPPQHNLHRTPPPPSTSIPLLDKKRAATISNANFAIKEIIDSLKERQASALETKSSEKDKEDEDLIRILLTGPPGTGKTTLAEAFAVALNRTISFIFPATATSTFQLQEYLNESLEPLLIRNEPCVIVIDEIDQLNTRDERDPENPTIILCRFINQFEAMDRGKPVPNFIFITTTNNEEGIPVALRSKFERIKLNYPDTKLREEIIRNFLNTKGNVTVHSECLAPQFIEQLVKKTKNFSIRDIQHITQTALQSAYAIAGKEREKSDTSIPICITKSQLNKAYDEVWPDTEAAQNRWHIRLQTYLKKTWPAYIERFCWIGIKVMAYTGLNYFVRKYEIQQERKRILSIAH